MNPPDDFLRLPCSNCGKRLKVARKLIGKTVSCPQCSAKVAVVDQTQQTAVNAIPTRMTDEDDGFKFLDDDAVNQKPSTSKKPSLLEDFDLSDFDLAPTPAETKSESQTFAKSEMDAIAAALQAADSVDKEFRHACKVCGAAMYARMSEVGNMARCPDCYAEFSIPRPLPGPKAKKAATAPKPELDLGSDLLSSAIDVPRNNKRPMSQADEYLQRAEQDIERDIKEQKVETYDFDTFNAFQKAFGFLNDSSVWILAAIPGLLIGLVFFACKKLAEWKPEFGLVGGSAIMLLFGLPLLAGCLANGLAILEASANKQKRVSQWPLYNLGEALGDIFMLVIVLSLAAIPGGVLGWLLTKLDIGGMMLIVPLASIWFLLPVILLSVLDSGSILQPFSSEVIGSMSKRADSWGAMYLWNALATLLLLLALYLCVETAGVATIVLGAMLIPFLVYFLFRQIGNLAVSIADVTELRFDMDENETEEANG